MEISINQVECIKCKQKFDNLGSEQTCTGCLAEFANYVPPPYPVAPSEYHGFTPLAWLNDKPTFNVIKMFGFFLPICPSKILNVETALFLPSIWMVTVISDADVLAVLAEFPDVPRTINDPLPRATIKLIGEGRQLTEIRIGNLDVLEPGQRMISEEEAMRAVRQAGCTVPIEYANIINFSLSRGYVTKWEMMVLKNPEVLAVLADYPDVPRGTDPEFYNDRIKLIGSNDTLIGIHVGDLERVIRLEDTTLDPQ